MGVGIVQNFGGQKFPEESLFFRPYMRKSFPSGFTLENFLKTKYDHSSAWREENSHSDHYTMFATFWPFLFYYIIDSSSQKGQQILFLKLYKGKKNDYLL